MSVAWTWLRRLAGVAGLAGVGVGVYSASMAALDRALEISTEVSRSLATAAARSNQCGLEFESTESWSAAVLAELAPLARTRLAAVTDLNSIVAQIKARRSAEYVPVPGEPSAAQLWEEAKVRAFTRVVVATYVAALLAVVVRVEVTLFTRLKLVALQRLEDATRCAAGASARSACASLCSCSSRGSVLSSASGQAACPASPPHADGDDRGREHMGAASPLPSGDNSMSHDGALNITAIVSEPDIQQPTAAEVLSVCEQRHADALQVLVAHILGPGIDSLAAQVRAIVAAVMFNVSVVAAPAPAPTLTAPADTPSRAASSAASTCNQHDVEGWLFAMLEALDGSATAHATTASQPRVVLTPGRRLLSSLLPSPDADGQFPRLAAAETPLSAASRESTSVSASPAHASVRAALLVPWTASLLVRLTIDAVHSPLATVAVEQAVQTNASTVMAAMRALVFKIKPQPQAQLAASGAADAPVMPSPPPSLTDDAAPEQPAVQLSLANVVLSLHTVVDALLTMRSQEPSAASPSGTVGTISAASPALLPLYLPPLVSLCDVLMFEAKI